MTPVAPVQIQTRRLSNRRTKKNDKDKDGAAVPAPATISVSLPADARLMVDGIATRAASATRSFVTPALEAGKDYQYTLLAEVVRDGKTLSASEVVTVRAGQRTAVTLTPAITATPVASRD